MQPYRTISVLAAVVLAMGVAIALPTGASSAAARCTAAQSQVTINGKRTCVPVRSVAPIKQVGTSGAFLARRLFGTAGIDLAVPRRRNGTPVRQPFTAADEKRLIAATTALETRGLAAANVALQPKSRAARRELARAMRAETPSATIGQPVVTVSDREASVRISGTVNSANGDVTTISLGLEARIPPDGRATADVEIGATTTDKKGVSKGNSFRATILGADAAYCPNAAGEIRYKDPYDTSNTSTMSEQVGPINSGTITTVRSTKSDSSAVGRMSANATLEPIPFKVTTTATLSMRGNGLIGVVGAVLGKFYAMNAVATGTGTINPATGAINAGSKFDVRTSGTGDAAVRSAAAKQALDEVRSMAARQYAHFKRVEKLARGGDCTRITFSPESKAALAKGETIGVKARLTLRDTGSDPNGPVTWTMTPGLGSVSPTKGVDNGIDTKVTGAAPSGGATARIGYRAVSRAGISTAEWTGEDTPFPARYTGTMDYQQQLSPSTFAGNATVTFKLDSAVTNPDGSKLALYSVESSDVTSIHDTASVGGCEFNYGPVAPGAPQTLETSDIEIQVTPQGAWSSAVKLGVNLGDKAGTMVCPPPAPSGPWNVTRKFLMNTRTPSAPWLRPMEPKGAIVGVGATDTLNNFGTSTANWNLQPGS